MMQKLAALTFLLTCACLSSAQSAAPNKESDENVKAELRTLFVDLNKAISTKDRDGLERVYAEEFAFVHSTGKVVSRAEHIMFILNSEDPASANPVATPDLERLLVYGDVAVLRSSSPGVSGVNIYAKKNGRWQIVHVQGTRFPPERKPVLINPKILDSYIGRYEFAPGAFAVVTLENEQLKWKGGARAKVTLVPLSESRFYAVEHESEMTFTRGPDGKVIEVTLRLGTCQETRGKRVD